MLVGYYKRIPAELGTLTVVELQGMLEGMDWMNDREWERLMFSKTFDEGTLKNLWAANYPHFRADRAAAEARRNREFDFIPAEELDG